jgi:Na+/H+ antiporter NhaD/arsenite permease-like protein
MKRLERIQKVSRQDAKKERKMPDDPDDFAVFRMHSKQVKRLRTAASSLLVSVIAFCLMISTEAAAQAADARTSRPLDLTGHWVGFTCLAIFLLAYAIVMGEEFFHLRKSIPVIMAAGVIWLLIGLVYASHGDQYTAASAFRHNLLEFGELFLFLLSAMTFINTMEERQVFDALRAWLVRRGFSFRALFWVTGLMAFVISPIADNLTTTLVMGAVAIAVGGGHARFTTVACINIVVAANAGGAFTPFGDITTLMVWQKGVISFGEFFALFIPALITWLVPAFLMSFAVENAQPPGKDEKVSLRPGAMAVVGLFIATIILTVSLHNFAHLPPVLGMMTGLGGLKLYAYLLKRAAQKNATVSDSILAGFEPEPEPGDTFDIFRILERVEWDTLMFFYGVILCVGGLGTLGYLAVISVHLYGGLGPTAANVLVGLLSAIVDNIPIMFAVLSMHPEMSHNQWLLLTLTAGVGGSLLSIGSAAGVALMGQARGIYTFFSHLKWSWAVALGYAAGIAAHLVINGR